MRLYEAVLTVLVVKSVGEGCGWYRRGYWVKQGNIIYTLINNSLSLLIKRFGAKFMGLDNSKVNK